MIRGSIEDATIFIAHRPAVLRPGRKAVVLTGGRSERWTSWWPAIWRVAVSFVAVVGAYLLSHLN